MQIVSVSECSETGEKSVEKAIVIGTSETPAIKFTIFSLSYSKMFTTLNVFDL